MAIALFSQTEHHFEFCIAIAWVSSKVINHRSWIVPRSFSLRNITSFSPGVQMIKIAWLGSFEPIYGLLWLTYNEIGLRRKLISCHIICIIFLFQHSLILIVWIGGPRAFQKSLTISHHCPVGSKLQEASHPKEYSVVSLGVTVVAAMVKRDYPFLDELIRGKSKIR